MLLAVALPTPFKIVGDYESTQSPRGSVRRRHYRIERGGYDGPIEVSLSDRQARHLQGVRGPTVVVPAGVSEFDYPVELPPWMELGRTARACVMGVGVVKDGGAEHYVSYSSVAAERPDHRRGGGRPARRGGGEAGDPGGAGEERRRAGEGEPRQGTCRAGQGGVDCCRNSCMACRRSRSSWRRTSRRRRSWCISRPTRWGRSTCRSRAGDAERRRRAGRGGDEAGSRAGRVKDTSRERERAHPKKALVRARGWYNVRGLPPVL